VSSAADKARAKAARIAAGSSDTGPTAENLQDLREALQFTMRSDAALPAPVSTKPIRISLDLAPALFDQLTEWRTRAARQLGRGRVTNADALRVLVRILLTDDELTARVIEVLKREASS
jgi:hypothetical protein